MRKRISRVTLGPFGLTVRLDHGPSLRFGDGTRLHAKWVAAQRVMRDSGATPATYLDVSVPERPVAGGVWDRADIERFIALGAGGVQMGTRFVGTFECDAHPRFKDTLLQAGEEDIVLMKSPVGMPARGVRTRLQARIETGTAPRIACISQCLMPCEAGRGAREAGYCIADRLGDAWNGDQETGLFFSGSNGSRLKELVSVRDLVEELTQDPGLSRRG